MPDVPVLGIEVSVEMVLWRHGELATDFLDATSNSSPLAAVSTLLPTRKPLHPSTSLSCSTSRLAQSGPNNLTSSILSSKLPLLLSTSSPISLLA